MTPRAWLDELTARYGESFAPRGPFSLSDSRGSYERECWGWVLDGRNATVLIDRYAGRTEMRAHLQFRMATLSLPGDVLTDSLARSVLFAAGLLDETPGSKQQEG